MSKKNSPQRRSAVSKIVSPAVPGKLLTDVRGIIDQARDATARAVNSTLVLLYWSIGDRIRRDILKEKRADYGKQIVGALSRQLLFPCAGKQRESGNFDCGKSAASDLNPARKPPCRKPEAIMFVAGASTES